MKNKTLLILILALAVFLRFYLLTSLPPSLNWDEVSHGYNAYSILKTGKDEWGKTFPLIFRAYGDYKLPVYIYLTVISEAIFGLNELAVRFPSALAGILAVLFTFLLVKELFRDKPLAIHYSLLASLLLAISPWHIFLSRPAFEANLASFLTITGIYFFLIGLKKNWFLPLGILFLGLSVHTYNSARIFVPLILVILILYQSTSVLVWAKEKRRELALSVILVFFLFGSLGYSFFSPGGQARFKWVSVVDEGTINRINEARASLDLPRPLPRLIHNKATYFGLNFAKNYLANLSPVYLFLKGGSNYQYNLPNQGVIYPIQAPFLLVGLYWLIKNWKRKESKLILSWWLLAIVPAAATRDNPHVLRTILVLPMPQIITAVGAFQIWQWWQKVIPQRGEWLGPIAYGGALGALVMNFWGVYRGSYRADYSWSWQYGYQQLASYIQSHYGDYDQILVTKKYGEPHEFLLFYLKWEPEKYRTDPSLVRYFQTDWYWIDSFDKFVFINDWEIKSNGKWKMENGKYLLITSPGNYSEGWSKIETIDFLDGKPAFEILER